MTDETPKKPLPFSTELPAPTPLPLPMTDEVKAALMTLIAHAVMCGAEAQTFDLEHLMHEELELGSWKVTVARVS